MNKENYLRRIDSEKARMTTDLPSLTHLQRQHLLNVPFENLDIHWKRPIVLANEAFYKKIVGENRGGFCYELNGLFYQLLSALGFQSKIISAKVSKGNGEFGAEYDHLAILTRIKGEDYLVDVGFGDFSAAPLKFVLNIELQDENGTFLIRKYDDDYFEVVKKVAGNFQCEYLFKEIKRDLAEFAEMCEFHQTSPESHFTRGKICSLMTADGGRKTLTDAKFVKTKGEAKTEIQVQTNEDFDQILSREFGIKRDY